MLTVIFLVTAIILAILLGVEKIAGKISNATLLWWMDENDCPFPEGEDLKRGNQWVIDHWREDLRGKK